MNRIDETTQRENRKLIAVYLKNADRYLKAREFERAAEEVDRALALEATNEYVQAYRERILELRHGGLKHNGVQREAVAVSRESPRSRKREEASTRVAERKHQERESKRQDQEERLRLELEAKLNEEQERRRAEEERKRAEEVARGKARDEEISTYLIEAEEFLQKEQFDRARSLVEKAFALDPQDPRTPSLYTRIREGMLAVRQRKADEEAKHREVQKRLHIYLERATNYLETGKLEKALDEVSEAASLDPGNAEITQLSEKVKQAIEAKQRAREEEQLTREEETRRRLEEEAKLKMEVQERRRREEEARLQAEEEARRQALLRKVADHLGQARENLEREKFKKALDEVENVFKLSPHNVEAVQLRETILLREEEKRRAEEEARIRAEEEARRRREEEERLKLERKVQGFIQSAEVYFRKSRFEKALSELNNAYILDPSNTGIKEFVDRIELAIEERRRAEEVEERKRQEEARRRFEEEALRKREEEERRRVQERERRKAEAESKRQAKLLRVHGYLAKALDELTTVRAIDPLNSQVTELENAVRETFEKADKTFPSGESETVTPAPSIQRPDDRDLRGREASLPLLVRERVPKARRTARALRKSKIQKRLIIAVAIAALLGVASLLLNRQLGFFSDHKALLVVPFRLSPDNPQENYLSEAIMMGIVSDFSAVPGLSVFNEKTAFALRQAGDAFSAAKQIHATHVLQGTIKKDGGHLVFNVTLNEALTGKSIWSKELSASSLDFVVVRNSIFDGVLEAIGVQGKARKPSGRGLTNDPGALEFYWKGRAALLGPGDEDFYHAIDAFDQALRIDGKFALALAGKAVASLKLYKFDLNSDPKWLAQAKELSEQALQINDQIDLAHRTLGSVLVYEQDFAHGMEEIQKTLTANPSDASAYRTIALVYAGMGDQTNAAAASEAALSLDPLNSESFVVRGIVKHLSGSYAEASAAYEQAIAFEPGIAWGVMGLLDNALLAQGSNRRALSLYENYLHLHPDDYEIIYRIGRAYQMDGQIQVAQPYFDQVIDLTQRELRRSAGLRGNKAANASKSIRAQVFMALAQTRLGRYSQARASAKRAVEVAPKDPTVLYGLAYMFSMQNDNGAALEWLRKAVASRYSYQAVLDVDLLNVRAEPVFGAILHASK
jgi:Tfp pilus assembly protein PilF/TolB-like protein